jgi:predicted phosphodiesterase
MDDATLVEAITALRGEHDLIVVNGDLLDLDRGLLPLRPDAELRVVGRAHERVLRALEGDGVIVLPGNHDPLLGADAHSETAVRVETASGELHIEHGHRFDAPLKQLRRFTALVTWGSGIAARAHLDPVLRAMIQLDRGLTGEGTGTGPIERGATRWLARNPDVAAMAIGHTHRSGVWQAWGRPVVNPGHCLDGVFRYATLEGSSGTITLHAGAEPGRLVARFGR